MPRRTVWPMARGSKTAGHGIGDVHENWVDGIKDDWPAIHAIIEASKVTYGDDIAAFLCFMAVRLVEMHRVLRQDGSMYLHCDPTASHYLKALMDAVFGRRNFQNEVTWQRTTAHSDAVRYGRNFDTILFYSKSDRWTWNTQYQDYDQGYIESHYRYKTDDGRLYRTDNLTATSLSGGGYEYEWNGITRIWRRPRESMKLFTRGRAYSLHPQRGGRVHTLSRRDAGCATSGALERHQRNQLSGS